MLRLEKRGSRKYSLKQEKVVHPGRGVREKTIEIDQGKNVGKERAYA